MDLSTMAFWEPIIMTIVYSLIGFITFALAFWVLDLVTPFSFRKEIEEDQNIALGIILAGVFIGLGLIIAAAIK